MPRSGWLAIGAAGAAIVGPFAAAPFGEVRALGTLLALAGALFFLGVIGPWRRDRSSPDPTVGRPGRRGRRATVPLAAGLAIIALRLLANGPTDNPPAIPDGDGPWSAVVEGVGSPKAGQRSATLEVAPGELRVEATLPRYPEIAPGDRVTVNGRLEPLPADDGGYGTYLRRIGVAATVRARSLDRLGTDGTTTSTIETARRASGDALTRALPEPEAGLAAGILIGLRDRVDRDLAAAFTIAGVSHVVAISGWNIAIVAAIVAACLRGRTGRRTRSTTTLAAIVAYTVAAGASPSVVRAAVMAAVVLAARETGRAGVAATALGWAVTALLVADPATVADPGFELSVLATGGLIAWATPITDRLRAWRHGRLPGWLAESLGVSFAAEAATLPVVLAGFGRFAVLAPAVNLAVVPLVPPAMAAGTLALVGGWLSQAGAPTIVATILGLPGWLVLTLLVAIVRFSAGLPFASITLPQPWGAVAGVMAAVIVFLVARGGAGRLVARIRPTAHRPDATGPRAAMAATSTATAQPPGRTHPTAKRGSKTRPRASRPARIVAASLALSVLGLVIVAANRPDGRVRVTVLDVGQGDAILVEGGRGGRLLVDGGPDPDKLLVALDARLPPWDRRIDLLILTHPHEDHVGGLALLLDRYRVGRTYEPGMVGPGPGYRAWQRALDRLRLRPGRLQTGDRFDLDEIRFRVLWPDLDAVPVKPPDGGTGINNVSIVLLGEVGRERFLLAGDIEEGIDPILVSRGLPRVDLLKIAHHGSRTSSTGPFLDAVRPRVAVASAGKGNPYGHPTKATLDRVTARGADVLRTDRNGSVEVTFDGVSELDVRPDRRDAGSVDASGAVGGTFLARPQVAFTCAIPIASG